MRKRLKENFPAVSERFSDRMDRTLEELRTKAPERSGEEVRWPGSGRPGFCRRVAGRGVAAAVVCVFLFFAVFPSYAADIPILNRIIYTISPLVRETGEGEARAAEKTVAVLKDFVENGVVMYTGQEDTGGAWQINTNTVQAAYCFRDKVTRYISPEEGRWPEVEITVRYVEAKRKGYEVSGNVACDVLVDGTFCFSEKIEVVLVERRDSLTVVGMRESVEPAAQPVTERTLLDGWME